MWRRWEGVGAGGGRGKAFLKGRGRSWRSLERARPRPLFPYFPPPAPPTPMFSLHEFRPAAAVQGRRLPGRRHRAALLHAPARLPRRSGHGRAKAAPSAVKDARARVHCARACVRAAAGVGGARRRATPGFCAVSRRRRRSRATSTRTRASARSPSPPPPASSRCPPSPAPRPASTGSRARALPPGLLGQAPGPAAYRRAQPTRRLREVGAGNIGRGAGVQRASALHHSLQAGPSPPPPRQGVRLLLEAQADLGGRDVGTGATPLMAAARTGRADVAEALLAACADPAARDESGRTALAVAAGEEVRLVLERVTPASARAAAGGGSRACFVS